MDFGESGFGFVGERDAGGAVGLVGDDQSNSGKPSFAISFWAFETTSMDW